MEFKLHRENEKSVFSTVNNAIYKLAIETFSAIKRLDIYCYSVCRSGVTTIRCNLEITNQKSAIMSFSPSQPVGTCPT